MKRWNFWHLKRKIGRYQLVYLINQVGQQAEVSFPFLLDLQHISNLGITQSNRLANEFQKSPIFVLPLTLQKPQCVEVTKRLKKMFAKIDVNAVEIYEIFNHSKTPGLNGCAISMFIDFFTALFLLLRCCMLCLVDCVKQA